ncbi:MAG: GLUG motif-containing protein, partial [Dehalococcoidia bacterium]
MKIIFGSRKHHHVARVSIFLIMVALIAGMVGCAPPIEIWDWYDLHAVRDNLGGSYLLMNDLDSTTAGYMELASETANWGRGWEPIGTSDDRFTGSFNGQGYEIRDLFINRPDENYVGLFGLVDEGGVMENVGVVNATVAGKQHVGGLVGINEGTVTNSYYNYDEVLINGENIITIGALFVEDFEQWLANDKFLDVNQRLSQEDGYYVIDNVSDFKELLAFGQDGSLKFRLTNDLDLGNEANFYIPYLAGEFDGNGHKILNLSFDFDFVSQVGLFGYLASGGRVTQVDVENVNITGAYRVGGLVGGNDGTVRNSYSSGSVTGWYAVGGLVGINEGTVTNSHSSGSATGWYTVGGLVGINSETVWNSYSTGSVTGNYYVGGLVGWNEGTVWNTISTGSVTGEWDVGGLVGSNYGTVWNSYSTGSVTGNYYVGGLVGRNDGTVRYTYSIGNVAGEWDVGGLVGSNYGT